MIILFLDIDGVLLSHRNLDSRISDYLNKKYIALGLPKSKWDDNSKARDKASVDLFDPIAIAHLNQLIDCTLDKPSLN